jgi:hypothetical protein
MCHADLDIDVYKGSVKINRAIYFHDQDNLLDKLYDDENE